MIGGGGYIGSIICRRLLQSGHQVRVLEKFLYGEIATRSLFKDPRFEVVRGDCRSLQTVVAAMRGVSSVIHLAAIVGDPACEQDRHAAREINYSATRMIAEIAAGCGVERFLFASSCSVYGEAGYVVDEKSAVNPLSLYARTKLEGEEALLLQGSSSFHPTVLRLATVFGHSYRPRFDLAVNLLTARACQGGSITIYNGEQWRPFINVTDAADGFIMALHAPAKLAGGQIFNLGGSNMNFTLSQVADVIQQLVPGTRVEYVDNPDRRNYRVSFRKIERDLGFHCETTLADGVQGICDAIHSGSVRDYNLPIYHNQRFLLASGSLAAQREVDARVMAAFASAVRSADQPLSRVVSHALR
ncbi:MAG: NAD(P)-dependent oxidoreductase [Candidatus Solibacter usitatus]|nr:NAD(P)-dependent oxidoreductase [Candidatus Solibacter usitatus]